MNRAVLSALAVLAFAGLAGASTVTCPAPPNGGVPVNVLELTIACGGLTFSNFNVIPAGGSSFSQVDLVSVDLTGGVVSMTLNPNLSGATGPQDVHFYYQVSGAVTNVDLTVGGVNATISETACSSPIPTSGPAANVCEGAPLANFAAFSDPPGPNMAKANVSGSSLFVFKDISVSEGGALSTFTQSFETGVPEPASMLLIGTACVALGMLRRRVRKP